MAYFAASVDPPDKNRAFAESLGVDYPILSDRSKAVAKAFGVLEEGFANRWTFYIGKDGKVLRIDREVNPRTAGADVAAALAALGVDRAP